MRYVGARSEILPYKLHDTGHDNLDDVVPSDKYRAEFGDGPVPITHTEHLYFRTGNETDHWLALMDTLSVFDRAVEILGRVDRDRIEPLLNEYRILRDEQDRHGEGILPTLHRDKVAVGWKPQERNVHGHRSVDIVRELASCGLKLRALRALVKADHLRQAFPTMVVLPFDQWVDIDKRCLRGESYKTVSDETGVHPTTVLGWYRMRGYDDEPVRVHASWLLHEHRKDFGAQANRAVVWDYLATTYPWCYIKPEAVMKRLSRDGVPERKDTWTKPWSND